jgi:glycine/D-amino acid oxidase-like deaminating enzyme
MEAHMEPITHAVAVIGGGIVGSAVALHLADLGVRPVLIDAGPVGSSASALSFASISAFDKDHLGDYELACAGMGSWRRWAERLGGKVGFRRGGEVRWESDPDQGRALAERVARAQARGYPVRLITEARLRELLPAAEPGPVSAAAHAEADAQVDLPKVLAASRAALAQSGVPLLTGRARIRLDDTGLRLEVDGEVLRPATVVLAAGAESLVVAAEVGLDVPTVPSPGMLLRTTPIKPIGDGVVYLPGSPGPPVHLRQLDDRHPRRLDRHAVLIGERSQETVAADPTGRHARVLLAQAARYFPALRDAGIDRVTVGWRPMPADRLPLVGPVPGLPELYLVVTHGGVTVAPALGRLVAREVAGGPPEPLLHSFRPGRFAARAAAVQRDVDAIFDRDGKPDTGRG